jgi:hypothetical protein
MAAQGNRVLISYNDVSKDPQNRDTAIELARDLSKSMSVVAKGYTEEVDPRAYDWLILVYSPEARKSLVSQTVENALDLTVKRHMRGVLAITPSPIELPPEWATIRKYDPNTPPELIKQAMFYAKTPYTREVMQELARTSSSALSRSQNKYSSRRTIVLTILGAVFAIIILPIVLFLYLTSPRTNVTLSNLATATAQAHKSATLTTATRTAQTTATASTLLTAQTLYTTTIKPSSATFTGFRDTEKWDGGTASCTMLDPPQNTMYQASVTAPNQYVRCMAAATNFKNFAYQVAMNITGDAGGVIFRSVEPTGVFYRFSVTPASGEFAVILCQSDCSVNTADGTLITKGQVGVDITKSVTLTIIAKESSVNLYVNGKFIDQLTDKLGSPGAIGVYAASTGTPTTVTFTNLKVWLLDKQPQPQGTPRR